ncbi:MULTISPECIES: hypothetical protein [unclassified Burkholderia]|uniref:hypothetical protein n=1 Tax=unclassified Burkholderia TaxID=2613784 RepID=UPI001E323CF8|nr:MULTISPECIES: hypothetical protein [unclassified Burkholderia]UEP26387.1 hypothetical protein LMA01_08635 [Burkholderia sp. B21-007]UEP39916.1 hypothetical protein LMA02_08615 [Burkholderia sp. B21-005]
MGFLIVVMRAVCGGWRRRLVGGRRGNRGRLIFVQTVFAWKTGLEAAGEAGLRRRLAGISEVFSGEFVI